MFASRENNAENVYFFYFQVISVETDLAGKFLPGRQCSSCWQTNLIATLLPMLANQYYCNSAPQSSCQLTNIITTLLLMLANQYYYNSAPHAGKPIVNRYAFFLQQQVFITYTRNHFTIFSDNPSQVGFISSKPSVGGFLGVCFKSDCD